MPTPEHSIKFVCGKMRPLFVVLSLALLIQGHVVLAQGAQVIPQPGAIDFKPEVPLPNFVGGPITADTFAEYIRAVFVYFIWIVGILAGVMIVWGGIKWVGAAGNPARINDARDVINNAIIGLVIALVAVVMLNIINPRLTSFRGITLQTVPRVMLEISQAVTQQTGGIAECSVANVAGSPQYVGSQYEVNQWNPAYNRFVNQAGQNYQVDKFLIKAVIQQESPKKRATDGVSSPYSGPATVPESRGSTRLSSSYGIGQWVATTLFSMLNKVNGTIPAECPTGAAARQANGSLVASCAQWLDRRLELQVKMVAKYLQEMSAQDCVHGDLALTAAGYHLGSGDIAKYCAGEIPKYTSTEDVVSYVNSVKTNYSKFCNQSINVECNDPRIC